MKTKLELLSPAGDLEKLKTAVLFGADAVYVGGAQYGLRAKAKNFSADDMREGVEFAHQRGVKVYVTINIYAHDSDFDGLEEYIIELYNMSVDGVIVSDPGVFDIVKQVAPNIEIHMSTQSNITNYRAAEFWKNLGASRIVSARELSIDELKIMSENLSDDFIVESFVHGAMCVSMSGRCLLSSYLSGMDANKGECVHPCRWEYEIRERSRNGLFMPIEEDSRGTYIMNSKDLCMIEHIPDLVKAGVRSFKIEGRMKTAFYVAVITNAYRKAIDDYMLDEKLYYNNIGSYVKMVSIASHREFYTGFYFGNPTKGQIYSSSNYIRCADFVGIVMEYDNVTGVATIQQRNKFVIGDEISVLTAGNDRENFKFTVAEMRNENGDIIESAPHPQMIVKINCPYELRKFDMMYIIRS